MKLPIKNLGQYGVINEMTDEDIPLNAWSKANNVDFRDGLVRKSHGYSLIFGPATGGSPYDGLISRPQWMFPFLDPEGPTSYWVICGIDDSGNPVVSSFDGQQILDITGTDLTITTPTLWNGGVCNGLPVINTGLEEPQMWGRNPASGALNGAIEALTNWPSGYLASVVRPFGDFLVALDIDNGAAGESRNPWRIMWSDAVEPFTPPEWTPTAENRAGDVTLGEGQGGLIDCLPLRGQNIIYSTQGAFAQRFIGGNAVFAFTPILGEYGILAQRCVKEFKDGMHFLVSLQDIVIHDGNTAQSVCDAKTRDFIFGEMDQTNYVNSFVASHYSESEMWFCYPTSGNERPNKVAKWNTKTGAWSFMEYPVSVSHIGWGVVQNQLGGPVVVDDFTGVIDSYGDPFNFYNPSFMSLFMSEYGTNIAGSNMHQADITNTFNGTTFVAELEKTGISVDSEESLLFCDHIYINGEGVFDVSVGGTDTPDGVYSWDTFRSHDTSTDYRVECRVSNRFLGVKIRSEDALTWRLSKYMPIIEPDGEI